LGKIEIPLLSESFQSEIEKIVVLSQETRKNSKFLYSEAENQLLNELGMADFSPSTENVNVKSFKNSFLASGRLDAEYYQPKYEQTEQLCFENAEYIKRVKDMQTHNGRGLQPDYVEDGSLSNCIKVLRYKTTACPLRTRSRSLVICHETFV